MTSEFIWKHRVEFAETDMAGIMHFSNFFRYMEMAEHAFYRSLGVSVHDTGEDRTVGWPRVMARCDFKRPLRFQDEVEVRLRVASKSEKSLSYDFVLINLSLDPPREAARGLLSVVCVELKNGLLTPVPIPEAFARAISAAPPEKLEIKQEE